MYGGTAQYGYTGIAGAYFYDGCKNGSRYYIAGCAQSYEESLTILFSGGEKSCGLGCNDLKNSYDDIAETAVGKEDKFKCVQNM